MKEGACGVRTIRPNKNNLKAMLRALEHVRRFLSWWWFFGVKYTFVVASFTEQEKRGKIRREKA